MISFGRGMPSVDIVAMDLLEQAATRAFAADPAGMSSYGPPAGYAPLRAWIAERHGVDVERVFISNGSMQAMWLLFDRLLAPGDAALVEAPTFDLTLSALRDHGIDVVGVPMTPDGLDLGTVRELLDGGLPARLLHVVPNFQNPTGATLPPAQRRELVELLADRGVLLLEDDPYGPLRFAGDPLAPMLSLAEPDGIIYSSSFSKTICPGVRVGYLVAPPELVEALATRSLHTYLSANMFSQAVVYQFCAAGALETAIAATAAALRDRAETLVAALRRELPEARFAEPQGGYFVWLELPDVVDAERVARALEPQGVTVMPGTSFMVSGGRHALRLSYASVTPAEIDEALARLADACRADAGLQTATTVT
jgi:2-aminoadipate transaminase